MFVEAWYFHCDKLIKVHLLVTSGNFVMPSVLQTVVRLKFRENTSQVSFVIPYKSADRRMRKFGV